MHPHLTIPAALLTSMGAAPVLPVTDLPPVSAAVHVLLPDFQFSFTTRTVKLQWSAGGAAVRVTRPLRAGRSGLAQECPVPVRIGPWRLELTATIERPHRSGPGQVTLGVSALIAGLLGHRPVADWQDVQPVSGEDLPVSGAPAPVALPDGQVLGGWTVTAFPHGLVAEVRTPGGAAHVELHQAMGVLALRLRAADAAEPVAFLVSFDRGASWVLRAPQGAAAPLVGEAMPAEAVRRLAALHAVRREPDVRVHADADADEWVFTRTVAGTVRTERIPRLWMDGAGLAVTAQLETSAGAPAGERTLVLRRAGMGEPLRFGKDALETLVDEAGRVLHVRTFTPAPVGPRDLQAADLWDGMRREQARAARHGDWLHASLALGTAVLSLLRRVDAERIAPLLSGAHRQPNDVTASWEEETRTFEVRAFGRAVVRVRPSGMEYPADLGRLDLSEPDGGLARACRGCQSWEGHEVFQALTGMAVVMITGQQALTLPLTAATPPGVQEKRAVALAAG